MVPTGAEEQATVPRLSVLLWVNRYLLSSQALRLLCHYRSLHRLGLTSLVPWSLAVT